MLGEVWREEGQGEQWQEEEVQEEIGLEEGVQQEVELEEGVQEEPQEGEVAVGREILSPAPFHGRRQTLLPTLHPRHSPSLRPQAHRLSFPALLGQLISSPPS